MRWQAAAFNPHALQEAAEGKLPLPLLVHNAIGMSGIASPPQPSFQSSPEMMEGIEDCRQKSDTLFRRSASFLHIPSTHSLARRHRSPVNNTQAQNTFAIRGQQTYNNDGGRQDQGPATYTACRLQSLASFVVGGDGKAS